ncbi:MAG: hypothetical protein LBU83_04045 [Bacteroidales bacterium]|jgi:hypothetical protein|nr:hypothetical protein [Bacteroidales bacterium]
MQENLTSEGKCLFCGKTFAKAGINRHLATHLKEKTETGKQALSFLLKVETNKRYSTSPYFLSLWIDGEAKMKDVDRFLRDIWLECCGHLSAFKDLKRRRSGYGMFDRMEAYDYLDSGNIAKYEKMMEEISGEIPMSRKVKDVFYKGLTLEYEYDFGSSTELEITVIDAYPIKADKKIVLLSRNEPLEIMCSICKKVPATQVCAVCMYNEDAVFCDKCAEKHAKKCEDFADYASMPVVNSPRMGVCAYVGGTIDKERDGVFDLKS